MSSVETFETQTSHSLRPPFETSEPTETSDELTYCEVCKIWLLYGTIMKRDGHYPASVDNYELVHCSGCHRQWDGNAQCPCWMDDLNKEPSSEGAPNS